MKLDPFIDFSYLKSNYKKIISPKGKVALVTGGSGRIGSIFVSLFLLNDFTVISTSRNKIKFNDFYKSIPLNYKKKLKWIKMDLSKPEQSLKTIKLINKKYKIDFLVNNAAFHYRGKNIEYTNKKLKRSFLDLLVARF